MENSREFWSVQPVIPVVVIDDEENAVPLARALVEGGLPRIEITLRTKAALGAINKISKEVPEALVGAGTVLNLKNLKDAIDAGAGYIVSPGTTSELRKAINESSIPSLPGAATVSEAMELMDAGFKVAKFFPAADSGGVNMLKSISTVLQDIAFCPTGGISVNTYKDYLSLPNVVCVGGSWVAPKDLIAAKDWNAITKLAEAVSKK